MKVTDFIVASLFASLFASTTLAAAITVASAPLKFYVKYNGLLRPLYGYYSTLANGDNLYVLSVGRQVTETTEFTLQGTSVITTQNYQVGLYHHVLSFGPNVVGTRMSFDAKMKLNIGPVYLCPTYQSILFTIRVGITYHYPSACFLVDLYLLPDQQDSQYAAEEPHGKQSDSLTPKKKDPKIPEPKDPKIPETKDTKIPETKDTEMPETKDPLVQPNGDSSVPEQSDSQRLIKRGTERNIKCTFEPEDLEEVGEFKESEKEREFDINDYWIF